MAQAHDGFTVEVLKIRRYKAGYEIRTEIVTHPDDPDHPVTMKSAYTTPEGNYIGNSKWAHRLIVKRGIKPELRTDNSRVCSIGFSERNQKWWGWSHRAMWGFSIGDTIEDEDHLCATNGWTDEWLAEHPEDATALPVGFEAKTLGDCKKMAVAFAAAIS